jgi:hypothetical protein
VQGNDFQMKGTQAMLSSSVTKAVIVGNVIAGPLAIDDRGSANPQIGLNAHD